MKRQLVVWICLGVAGLSMAVQGVAGVAQAGYETEPHAKWIAVGRMTDGQGNGEFLAEDIPCKAYWFDPWERPKYDNIRSETISFSRPGAYEAELALDAAKNTLTARVVSVP